MGTKMTPDNLVKLFADATVVEALTKALMPAVEAALAKTWGARLLTAETHIIALQGENTLLKEHLSEVETRVDKLETEMRRDSIMFTGLAEETFAERATMGGSLARPPDGGYASVEKTVLKFCKDYLHVDIVESDISTAYRLKAKNAGSVRPTVVRFKSLKVRDTVYRARSSLKGTQSRVFLSEHLSSRNSALYYEARLLQKSKKIASTWTQGGLVYYKMTNDQGEKPIPLRSTSDLP
jgi:hypothetical protein